MGTLGAQPSAAGSASYVFNPETDDACSGVNQRVAYMSAPLENAIDLVGAADLVMHVSIDTPDADIFAYLGVEVNGLDQVASQLSRRLRFRDSMSAPTPVPTDQDLELHLSFKAVAFRLEKGARLFVTIKSTACGYAENPNTGGSMVDDTTTQPVTVTVLTGPDTPSRIELPVL